MVGRAWRAPGAGVPLQARARMHRAPLSKRAVAVRCSASSHRADGGRVYYAEVCVPAELPDAPEVLPMRDISLNLPVEEEKGACARGRRNAWNSFQAEWAGQGLTRKEVPPSSPAHPPTQPGAFEMFGEGTFSSRFGMACF